MGDDEGDLGADVTAQFDTYAPRTIPAPPARTRPRRSGGSGRRERSPLGAPRTLRGGSAPALAAGPRGVRGNGRRVRFCGVRRGRARGAHSAVATHPPAR